MLKRLAGLFARKPARRAATAPRKFVPRLEGLESRDVPSVTYHGGAVLPHEKAQALYYGSDWYSNRSLYNQTGQFEGFLKYVETSSYFDALASAGYGVGRGSFDQGRIDLSSINKAYYLTDSAIRSEVQANVNSHALKAPDTNRLYVVFVEPGVSVLNDHARNGDGSFQTSIKDFQGYHGAFAGSDGYGHRINIAYAVIPYQTGSNAHDYRVSTFNSMTETTSHELAEAATDPMTYGFGWYDNASRNEIGDFSHNIVGLGGYVVQRVVNKNYRDLVPAGSYGLAAGNNGPVTRPNAGHANPAVGVLAQTPVAGVAGTTATGGESHQNAVSRLDLLDGTFMFGFSLDA
jgi:hypothetical protein